jgi:hypothetical protein
MLLSRYLGQKSHLVAYGALQLGANLGANF